MDTAFLRTCLLLLGLGQALGYGVSYLLAEKRAEYLSRAVRTEATLVGMREVSRTTQNCRRSGSGHNRRNCTSRTHTSYQHILNVRVNGRVVRAEITESRPMPYQTGESFEVLADPDNPTDVRNVSFASENSVPVWPRWAGLGLSAILIILAWAIRTTGQARHAQAPQPLQPGRMPWDGRKAS